MVFAVKGRKLRNKRLKGSKLERPWQTYGMTMGSQYAASVGNACVRLMSLCHRAHMEAIRSCAIEDNDAHTLHLTSTITPPFEGSFLDDIFGVWEGSMDSLLYYISKMGNLNHRYGVKKVVNTHTVDFLDIVFYKGERFKKHGVLDTRTHQKSINTYLYIPYNSFHTTNAKISFICAELDRYCSHSSNVWGYTDIKRNSIGDYAEEAISHSY